MRGEATGVGHQTGHLGEEHDPGRIRHLADDDVALADLVELIGGENDACHSFHDARRSRHSSHLSLHGRRLSVEFVRESPVAPVRNRELRRRHGADPVGGVESVRGGALLAAPRDRGLRLELRRIAHENPELVVSKEDDVVGRVQHAHPDELVADRDQDEAQMGVRALVDIEVVVGRERRHLEVDAVDARELLARLAGQTPQEFLRGRIDIGLYRGNRLWIVVVGFDITTHQLEHGFDLLAHRWEDELVAPDRVIAVLALIGHDAFDQEALPAIRFFERLQDVGSGLALKCAGQLRVGLHLLLQLPERLDGVPVAVTR